MNEAAPGPTAQCSVPELLGASAAVVATGPPPPPPPGPIAQSVAIGFRAIYIIALLLVLVWLTSNVREIASGNQAVVRRFGRIVRSQEAGLLVAWPRPIEQVQLLPGPERQLSQEVLALPSPTERFQEITAPGGAAASAANASAYLTGDGNVVLLSASLIYHIEDAIAYALAEEHVAPALDRLFRAATVRTTASHNLNGFLVVQGAASGDESQHVVALRAEVRDSLLGAINARLQALSASGASLGVELERIDMTAWLPPQAKSAFDEVLIATQSADRGLAMARTDAERRRQGADREREQLLSSAQASAKEMLSTADVETASIVALEREETPVTRSSLLWREYRTKIGDIFKRTGSVTVIDPRSGARFLLPGKPAAGQQP